MFWNRTGFFTRSVKAASAEIYIIGKELLTDAVKMDGNDEVTIDDIGASGTGSPGLTISLCS